ncbi:hypothetical protein DOY81_009704 [Sarcophaga bullata]|nr:hypothetical protein DOY81_009704 [Sarcophaga bullata]
MQSNTSRRQSGTHNHNRPKRRPPRRYHRDQHDAADTLCSIIFCNSNYTARVLFELLSEMSRQDPGLKFIKCQFTTDRVADPITEPKEAEVEHRRQEEVLKRFRMHDCNVLIGTSVLEEGIDVPKCNLVVRWDPPTTYRSYVQCKGRARAIPAYHVLLVASDWKDLINLKPETEQITNKSHRLICSLPKDENDYLTDMEKGDEDTTEDEEDKQINGISTKQKFVYGSSKGTIKILNPEVITTKPPSKPSSSNNDLVLKEIKVETLAIEDVKYNSNKTDIKDVYEYSTNSVNSTISVLNEDIKNTSENSISSYESNTSSVIESNTSHKEQNIGEMHETDGNRERLNDTKTSEENVDLNESSCSSILSKYNEDEIYKVFNLEEALKELDSISKPDGYNVKENKSKGKPNENTVPPEITNKKSKANENENIVNEKKEKKKFVCLLQTAEHDEIDTEDIQAIAEAKQFENMENTTNTIVQQMAEYREIEKVKYS